MALINCPECGKKISDDCESCVKCGCKIDSAVILYGMPNYKRRRRKIVFRIISLAMSLIGVGLIVLGVFCVNAVDFSYKTSLSAVRRMCLEEDFREKTGESYSYAESSDLVKYYSEYSSILDNNDFDKEFNAFYHLAAFVEAWDSSDYRDSDFTYVVKRNSLFKEYFKDCDTIRDVRDKCYDLKWAMFDTINDHLCSDTDMVNERIKEYRLNKIKYNWYFIAFFPLGAGLFAVAIVLFVKTFKPKYNP